MSTLLKAFLIARHQQWRVLQVSLIAHKLCVGRTQALVLALVLPAEVSALPHIGPTVAATYLLSASVKRIELAVRIDFGGRRLVQNPTKIKKMFM